MRPRARAPRENDFAERVCNVLAPIVWAMAVVLIVAQVLIALADNSRYAVYAPPSPAASVLVRMQFQAQQNGVDTSFPPVPAGVVPAGIPFWGGERR